MISPSKMPQRAMVRIWVASLHQKSTKVPAFVLFFFCSFIQFFAHLAANLFAPLVIDLRVDCKGRTGLCVSGFCGYCRHTDLRVGQQDAHKSVPEHMRMQPFNACPLSDPANQCAVAVRVDRKSMVVADHEVRPPKGKERWRILAAFLIQTFLPTPSHEFFLGLPILMIFFEEVHVLWSNVHIADVAFLCSSQLVAVIFEYQKRFRNMYGASVLFACGFGCSRIALSAVPELLFGQFCTCAFGKPEEKSLT